MNLTIWLRITTNWATWVTVSKDKREQHEWKCNTSTWDKGNVFTANFVRGHQNRQVPNAEMTVISIKRYKRYIAGQQSFPVDPNI
jgi:hypothetical protein